MVTVKAARSQIVGQGLGMPRQRDEAAVGVLGHAAAVVAGDTLGKGRIGRASREPIPNGRISLEADARSCPGLK
jgi:hypothetical protein